MSLTESLNELAATFTSDPGSSSTKLSYFIRSHFQQLFEEGEDWIVKLINDSTFARLDLGDPRFFPALTHIFAHHSLPTAALISGLQHQLATSFPTITLIESLLNKKILSIPRIYNAIWLAIKSATHPSIMTKGPGILDQTPLPLDPDDFPVHFDWFRYYLSKYFTLNPSFGEQSLSTVVETSFSIASTKERLQSKSIPPFSIQSCFQHNLINSYEEYQYYQQNPAFPSTTDPSRFPPPHRPPHIVFPDHSSTPHPYFTLNPTAMSDPHIVQTEDFQSYFIRMFIIGSPLESLLPDQLQTAPSSTTTTTTTTTHRLMETPINNLHLLSNKLDAFTPCSTAFRYQMYLVNFRLHLIDFFHNNNSITSLRFLPIPSTTPLGYSLLDPLFYRALSQPRQQPQRSESHQYQFSANPSNTIFNTQYDPSNALDQRLAILLEYLSHSVLNHHLQEQESLQRAQHRTPSSTHLTPSPQIIPSSPQTAHSNSSFTSLNQDPFFNQPNLPDLFSHLFTHIIKSEKKSLWCVEDQLQLYKSPISQAPLRAFIIQSYHQFQSNTPTLYQQLYQHYLTSKQNQNSNCFLSFFLLAPLFAFRNCEQMCNDVNITPDSITPVQMHITLLIHAAFINPSTPTCSVSALVSQPFRSYHSNPPALIPIRAAISTWLMIHSGILCLFPTPPQGSSQGNLFYHGMQTLKALCLCDHGHSDCENEAFLDLLKPFPSHNITNSLIENPLKTTANAALMKDVEKLVMDRQGDILYVELRGDQTSFPAEMISPSPQPDTRWDAGLTVIDFDSSYSHTSLADFISNHTKHSAVVANQRIPPQHFDFDTWRLQFKTNASAFVEWDGSQVDDDRVDELLTDEVLYAAWTADPDADYDELGLPPESVSILPDNWDDFLPPLKHDTDSHPPHQFSQVQWEAMLNQTNQQLLRSPQIIALQRQYKAYLKEVLQCESTIVANVLKDVVMKAESVGLFRSDIEDHLFRSYPFPFISPTTTTKCAGCGQQNGPTGFQKWCVEMLLVSSLNIQPHFDENVHTRLYISQNQHPNELQEKKNDARPCIQHCSSHFFHPRRTWLSTLPHVDLKFDTHNPNSNQFIFDSLLHVIAEVVMKSHTMLLSLCEEEEEEGLK